MQAESALEIGKSAHKEGRSRNRCPYKFKSADWHNWNIGWIQSEGERAWHDQSENPDTSGFYYQSWQYNAFQLGYLKAARQTPVSV